MKFQLETRQKQIEQKLSEESFYQDPVKSNAVLAEYKLLRDELPRLYERWQEAELELDKLEVVKNKELEIARSGGNA